MPDPAGIFPPGSGVYRENMKKCTRCLEDKPKSEFYKNAAKKDGLDIYCRQCQGQMSKEYYVMNREREKKRAAAWRENNPDYRKEWGEKNPDKVKEHEERKKLRRYGITVEQYNNLLDQQNNRCAICREESKDGKSLHVDHDHSCCKGKKSCGKCVRQLLCGHCNRMLGCAKDNPEILEAAKKYLERHSRPKNLAKNLD